MLSNEIPAPVLAIAVGMLILSFALAALRCWRGPTVPDRVMALDLVGALLMGACTLLAIQSKRELFLDVALAVAVIAFLGTIAFARQIEDNPKHPGNDPGRKP